VSGDTLKLQPGDWVTVKTWPAIVSVPVRDGPVVGATVTLTVPVDVPDIGATEAQLTLLEAVHGQPAPAVTVTTVEPPAAPAEYVNGVIENVQPSDCVTLKCNPAIVTVPVRGGPVVDTILNATDAEPLPFAVDTSIHGTSDAALHEQRELDARSSTLPFPPV
jgi:hypothetical protein